MKRTTVYYIGGAALIFAVLLQLKRKLRPRVVAGSKPPVTTEDVPKVDEIEPRLIEFDAAHPRRRIFFINNPPEYERDYTKPFTFWNPPPGHFSQPNIFSEPQTYYFMAFYSEWESRNLF